MTANLVLSPKEAYTFISSAMSCKQVPYIAGPPGIGKSQIVAQIANDANAKMIDLRLSQMLSEDLTGLPERDQDRGKAVYLPFDTFPLEDDTIPDGYKGWILFLDELSSASEEILAAVYSLILDRTVGGKKLHDKVLIVAAGNLASNSAIARELPDTLITRMLPFILKTNAHDWVKWAKNFEKAHPVVIKFISNNRKLLHEPKDNKEELEPYPAPRGWEKVFAHMHMHDRLNAEVDHDAGTEVKIEKSIFHLISSAVGWSAAKAFSDEYTNSQTIPEPYEIIQGPSTTLVPKNPTLQSKTVDKLIEHFKDNKTSITNKHLEACNLYMNNLNMELREKYSSGIIDYITVQQHEKTLSVLGLDIEMEEDSNV